MIPFLGPVWCTQSIVLTVKGGSALTRWYFRVSCFLVKKHAAFKWKDAISKFPVCPGSAEALVRWGGKIKYILIAYFLSNICAKNRRNRTVCVKIIASQRSDDFWETVYCLNVVYLCLGETYSSVAIDTHLDYGMWSVIHLILITLPESRPIVRRFVMRVGWRLHSFCQIYSRTETLFGILFHCCLVTRFVILYKLT